MTQITEEVDAEWGGESNLHQLLGGSSMHYYAIDGILMVTEDNVVEGHQEKCVPLLGTTQCK